MLRLASIGYFLSLTAAILVGGSLFTSQFLDVPGLKGDDRPDWRGSGLILSGSLAIAIVSGICCWKARSRRFWFGNIAFALWLPLTFTLAELLARQSTPAWPANVLHGVQPEVSRKAWGQHLAASDVGFNSWGQRDRERTLRPAPGIFRIGFIGDSFLEESEQPVSLRAEQLWPKTHCEMVNLGVSATQPDEYFDRLRSVAIPLGCRHCVVWIFSGNDFVDEPRTLNSRWGFCAVAPRPSLLGGIGCRSINHLLMNHQRPLLTAWFSAGDLAARENALHELLLHADDRQIHQLLLNSSGHSPAARANVSARLNQPEINAFFEILRYPDAGKFRSYYLTSAVLAAAAGNGQWDPNPESHALYWAQQMRDYCGPLGVRLTFVVIPEAFQVDSRMRDQWLPLCDMRHVTQPCRAAADRFVAQASEKGLDVLDLHPVFQDIPGTYLNLDGHWSQAGVELAAEAILRHLNPESSGN